MIYMFAYMIFGNKTVFLGNNLANVDHISMNMRDVRSMKVFKIFSKFQNLRWKNFQVHKNSFGKYIYLLYKLKTWILLKMKIFMKLHLQIKIRKVNYSFSRKNNFKTCLKSPKYLEPLLVSILI